MEFSNLNRSSFDRSKPTRQPFINSLEHTHSIATLSQNATVQTSNEPKKIFEKITLSVIATVKYVTCLRAKSGRGKHNSARQKTGIGNRTHICQVNMSNAVVIANGTRLLMNEAYQESPEAEHCSEESKIINSKKGINYDERFTTFLALSWISL